MRWSYAHLQAGSKVAALTRHSHSDVFVVVLALKENCETTLAVKFFWSYELSVSPRSDARLFL